MIPFFITVWIFIKTLDGCFSPPLQLLKLDLILYQSGWMLQRPNHNLYCILLEYPLYSGKRSEETWYDLFKYKSVSLLRCHICCRFLIPYLSPCRYSLLHLFPFTMKPGLLPVTWCSRLQVMWISTEIFNQVLWISAILFSSLECIIQRSTMTSSKTTGSTYLTAWL